MKINITIFFIAFYMGICILPSFPNTSNSESNATANRSKNIYDSEMNSDSSEITTKVYKSTDQTSQLIDEVNDSSNVDDDILSKEELLHGIRYRNKSHKNNLTKYFTDTTSFFIPFSILVFLLVLISMVFLVIKSNKI